MRKLRVILISFLLAVLVAASGYDEAAASSITIETAGTAAYSIKATDLQESAGMELSISYDTATLKDPKVTSGSQISGALMVANATTPGLIRIGIATGGVIKGTGELVSITFTKVGTAPAPKPTVSSSVYSIAGSQLAVQSTAQPDPNAAIVTENKDSNTGGSGGVVTAGTGNVPSAPNPNPAQATTSIGSVSLSQETDVKSDVLRPEARKDERREEPVNSSVPEIPGIVAEGGAAPSREAATAAVPETGKAGIGATLKSSQSVLDRFRAYKGVRTLKRLSALFDRSDLHTAGVVQSPAIVVADGKSIVTITVDLLHEVDTPNFSLKGANLKSIRRVSDRKWELDALPRKGKSDVWLSILQKGGRAEIPLVAVPPINRAGAEMSALSDAGLDALLAKPVKNNKPSYDLNSDGRQDYVDDYILVGHWLLKQQQSVKGVGRKPAAAGK